LNQRFFSFIIALFTQAALVLSNELFLRAAVFLWIQTLCCGWSTALRRFYKLPGSGGTFWAAASSNFLIVVLRVDFAIWLLRAFVFVTLTRFFADLIFGTEIHLPLM
jgi:hypothetical protein